MKKKIIIGSLVLFLLVLVVLVVRDIMAPARIMDEDQLNRNDGKDKIAIIDSGANLSQVDYDPALKITMHNVITNNENVNDYNKRGTMIFSSLYNSRSSMKRKNEVMIIKAFENTKQIDSKNILKALKYACDNDASIINIGYNLQKRKKITNEIKKCQDKGAVIVAAGNSKMGTTLDYPANLDKVISVGLLPTTYKSTVIVDPNEQQVCIKGKCMINKNVALSTAYVTGYLSEYKDKYKASKNLTIKPTFGVDIDEDIKKNN